MYLPRLPASHRLRASSFIAILLVAAGVFLCASLVSYTGSRAASATSELPVSQTEPASSDAQQQVAGAFGKLPLSFTANLGQADARARFIARGPGYSLFLTGDEAVIALHSVTRDAKEETAAGKGKGKRSSAEGDSVVRMRLIGANKKAKIDGLDELPGKLNYFTGNDSRKWRTNVPAYSQVKYHQAYPGIDVVYHGNQQQLEYDFLIAPGAAPERIRMSLKGARQIVIDKDGNLLLSTAAGELRQAKPVAYQEINGERREVAANFKLKGNEVAFVLGSYDRSQPLVIDPVFIYSTFIGGSNLDRGFGIAVDSQGSAYITGRTSSLDFPVANPFQATRNSLNDAFVIKLNPAGTALSYGTYLGGNAGDFGNAIAVDAQGSAYVTGSTFSSNFPVTPGALQSSKNGLSDGFAVKLSPSGSSLAYATYLGGENTDVAYGIAVDFAGQAHLAGFTESTAFGTFPFSSPQHGSPLYKSNDSAMNWSPSAVGLTASWTFDLAIHPGNSNIIYAGTSTGVFKSTDAGAHWSLTGSGNPVVPASGAALAIDPLNPAIIYAGAEEGVYKSTDGGNTYALKNNGLFSLSVDELAINPLTPTTLYAIAGSFNLFKSTNGGDNWVEVTLGSGFEPVTEVVVDPTNPAIVYAGTSNLGVYKTTNGGTSWSPINTGLNSPATIDAFAIDPLNPAILYTASQSFTDPVYKSTDGGAHWSPSGSGITITDESQTSPLQIHELAVSTTPGTVYAATENALFKTTDGGAHWSPSNAGLANLKVTTVAVDLSNPALVYAGAKIGGDAFAAKINSAGSALNYAVNLGGNEYDEARAIALDGDGSAYVVGMTGSPNFPAVNPVQSTYRGKFDAFLTKLSPAGALVSSTYLGGNEYDFAVAVAVHAGQAIVTGQTVSSDFPLIHSLKPPPHDFYPDAFVTKFSASGTTLDFSTCLGGAGDDTSFGIAVDSSGAIYVTGATFSPDFPIVDAPQPVLSTTSYDAFVTKLNPAGMLVVYSTFLGGSNDEQGNAIAVDAAGNAYVTGITSSTNFPVVGAFQPTLKGNSEAFITKLGVIATTKVQFAQPSYLAEENSGSIQINVSRSGDVSGPTTVNYTTLNGSASERSDYTAAVGALRFGPGETLKSFVVLLTDDAFVESSSETVRLRLSNPSGAGLDNPAEIFLSIHDNDVAAGPNPIGASEFFVRQHYHDFLNREPDAAGLQFWVNQIESCDADANCRELKRINVSAAFFLSIEFQETGYLVYRMYNAAYGDRTSPNVPGTVPIIRLQEFLPDSQQISRGVQVGIGDWQQQLEDNKNAYALDFVQRQRFLTAYPLTLTADDFVTRLNFTAGGVLSADEKAQLIALLGTTPGDAQKRGSVVRKVAEDSDLRQRELNRAFVLMEYYGYLRRNPDDPPDADFRGWKFWLDKLNEFDGNFVKADMVKSFLVAGEYRRRFGTP